MFAFIVFVLVLCLLCGLCLLCLVFVVFVWSLGFVFKVFVFAVLCSMFAFCFRGAKPRPTPTPAPPPMPTPAPRQAPAPGCQGARASERQGAQAPERRRQRQLVVNEFSTRFVRGLFVVVLGFVIFVFMCLLVCDTTRRRECNPTLRNLGHPKTPLSDNFDLRRWGDVE